MSSLLICIKFWELCGEDLTIYLFIDQLLCIFRLWLSAKMILSEKDLQLLSSLPTQNDSDNDRKDNDLKIGKN